MSNKVNLGSYCYCDKLKTEIEKGLKSLHNEKAPSFVIEDYISDMLSGNWVGCIECAKEYLKERSNE